MQIKRIVVGPIKTNCYILIKEDKCLIIDPGAEYDNIKKIVQSLKIEGILITHYHFDHIGALKQLLINNNIEVYDINKNEGKYIVGPFEFEIIYNPGHSKDSVTFYFEEEKSMFVGDFIFKDDIGRTDLPTGSFKEMQESLLRFKRYDKDIIVYPGHDEQTTLGLEISKYV